MESVSKLLGYIPLKVGVNGAAAVVVVLMFISIDRGMSSSVLQTIGAGVSHIGVSESWTSTAHAELTGDAWGWYLFGLSLAVLVGTVFGVATAVHWQDGVRAPSLSWGTYIAIVAAGGVTEILGPWGFVASAGLMGAVGLLAARAQSDRELIAVGFCPLYVPFCVLFQLARPRFHPRVDDYL